MTSKVTLRQVVFSHRFKLARMRQPHSAGAFDLRIEHEPLEVSWEAYRMRYTLMLPTSSGVEAWETTSDEIDALLAADRQFDINTGFS